ncbi:MAG: hypothetical protein Q7P63_12350 [Verrucomicrobiota bacterium JB022]|nr:hypothetical protein [Verrucomicrobiota bacterium JB022]
MYGYTIGYDGRGLMVSRSKDGEAWSFGWDPCEKPWWIFKGEVGHEYGYTASGVKYRHVQVNGQTNGQWNRTKATFFLGDLEQDWENANGTWSVAETRLTISGPGGAIGVCTIAGDHVQGQPKRQWYHKDHLGSVAFVTDEAGSVSRYSYDAWGHRPAPQTRERVVSRIFRTWV